MSDDANPRLRDRARTEAAILAAARNVLAQTGFQGFGVNAVARQAGCDKQLIYRYFGGLEGLVDAMGAELALRLEASLDAEPAVAAPTYAAFAEHLLLRFLDSFRDDVLVQRIAAWEISDASPLVGRLSRARGAAMLQWMARTRGDLVAPAGVDAPALNAVLIAAAQQLVLASSAMGGFSGVALQSAQDWDRIRAAFVRLVRSSYAEPAPDA